MKDYESLGFDPNQPKSTRTDTQPACSLPPQDDPEDEFDDDVRMWVHQVRAPPACHHAAPVVLRLDPHFRTSPLLTPLLTQTHALPPTRPTSPPLQGGELVDTINSTHENPAYFPGIPLGPNVIATGNLAEAVADADLLVFCAPHQYIRGICKQLMGKVRPRAIVLDCLCFAWVRDLPARQNHT